MDSSSSSGANSDGDDCASSWSASPRHRADAPAPQQPPPLGGKEDLAAARGPAAVTAVPVAAKPRPLPPRPSALRRSAVETPPALPAMMAEEPLFLLAAEPPVALMSDTKEQIRNHRAAMNSWHDDDFSDDYHSDAAMSDGESVVSIGDDL